MFAVVLRYVGNDGRSLLTGSRHEDVLGGVGRRGRVHESSLGQHGLDRRRLKLLV